MTPSPHLSARAALPGHPRVTLEAEAMTMGRPRLYPEEKHPRKHPIHPRVKLDQCGQCIRDLDALEPRFRIHLVGDIRFLCRDCARSIQRELSDRLAGKLQNNLEDGP